MSRSRSSRPPFDARERRVIHGLCRWVGMLGRFQIIGAVFVFLLLLAGAGLVATLGGFEDAGDNEYEQPLVTFGEVSSTTLTVGVVAMSLFALIFLHGGMLLLGAADDIDAALREDGTEHPHLAGALNRLRSYFVLETGLMSALAVAATLVLRSGWFK